MPRKKSAKKRTRSSKKDFTSFEVQGFEEVRKNLTATSDNMARIIAQTDYEIGEAVIARAHIRAAGVGGVAPKSARSLRMERVRGRARVMYGGTAYPYAMGGEFGSYRYHQFKPFRRDGYFLFKARRDVETGDILMIYRAALARAIRNAFPEDN
ncbi:hypothetical protein ACFY2K_26235 [Kitasatospora sp. NPDC001309]|uniref:hypothetical protein n=1 Tax=Kitasatospora sp. NPDC001309 TaxID=3364013 RepID=UPI00367E1C5F